jgi:hypothetical protein
MGECRAAGPGVSVPPGKPPSLPAASARARWRRRCRTAGIAAGALVAVAAVATGRLFVWPASGMPARVSAIVILNAPDDRIGTALRLARQHRAPFLVISLGTPDQGPGDTCPPPIPAVRVICFFPRPATTQGEAEFVGRLARRYHWRSVALVTIKPQDSRARLRVSRCFPGPVYVVTTPIPLGSWPYEIAYEWGAMVKALFVQRGC